MGAYAERLIKDKHVLCCPALNIFSHIMCFIKFLCGKFGAMLFNGNIVQVL